MLAVVGVLVLAGLAAWASARVRHPENMSARHHGSDDDESDELYAGADRPAGPDAEDAPTAVPNRADTEPPAGSTGR